MQHDTNVKLGKLWISVGLVTVDLWRHFVTWEWAVNSSHTPSMWLRIPEEHGGAWGLASLLPFGVSRLSSTLSGVRQGATPGCIPHPKPM